MHLALFAGKNIHSNFGPFPAIVWLQLTSTPHKASKLLNPHSLLEFYVGVWKIDSHEGQTRSTLHKITWPTVAWTVACNGLNICCVILIIFHYYNIWHSQIDDKHQQKGYSFWVNSIFQDFSTKLTIPLD